MTHVEGEVDPIRDFGIISDELRLKDIESLTKEMEKVEKILKRGDDKKAKLEYVGDFFCWELKRLSNLFS